MKALKYIAGICLALSLTSCDDYLTQTSPDKLTSDSYWRDKADVESAMSSAYSQRRRSYQRKFSNGNSIIRSCSI
jgi:starch-binding outer membrane protein, SusD/RagB family